jgi:CheY-like chemotaxis protein
VLIVDNQVAVQRTTRSLRAHYSDKTLVANDGIEASELFEQYQDEIQLVVMDVMMPRWGE